MKKVLCVLVCMLLLSGCGMTKTKEVEKEPLIFSGFNTVVKTKINNIEICGNARYAMNDAIYFEFSAPETINGTKIICRDGEYQVDFSGLSITLAGSKLPFNMICKSLETCINNVQGTTPQKDSATNQLFYTYSAEGYLCKLYVDAQTKEFIKLTVNEEEILYFENFEYLGQTE